MGQQVLWTLLEMQRLAACQTMSLPALTAVLHAYPQLAVGLVAVLRPFAMMCVSAVYEHQCQKILGKAGWQVAQKC